MKLILFLAGIVTFTSAFSNEDYAISDMEIINWIEEGTWVKDPDAPEYGTEGGTQIYARNRKALLVRYKSHKCIEPYAFVSATWAVKDRVLELTVIDSDDQQAYPVGEKIRHRVNFIKHKKLQLEGEDGHKHNLIREISGCVEP
ncbi:MAG: hypothetical protein O6852_05450 [Gammaproteobacteria bacterium]|nr:hypothetical protein [Gammaproteobacteria bacterium]